MIVNFSSKILCDQAKSVSLFCDYQMLHKLKTIFFKDPEHALYGGSKACPMGAASDRWYTKPIEEATLSSPRQFDSSTGHDKPVLTVMVGFSLNHSVLL